MLCPNDNIEMRQVKVASHYGQTVLLDQCPGCGGIWFDHFELYKAKQGEADKIELMDAENLRHSVSIKNADLLCPKDSTKLVRFKDLLFPEDIIIARCPVCQGFWLNRGEFARYQKYRESLKKPQEVTVADEKAQRAIERILAEHKTGDTTGVLGKAARFLSTPADNVTWRPLEPEKLSEKEKSTFNLMINALFTILRLFVRV